MVRARAGLAETDDEATTRARDRGDASRSTSPTRPSGAGSSPRCSPCSASASAGVGGRDELFAAWRTFFERIAATGTVVLRVRGPPLGRPGPARLHRPPARVEPRRPDPRRHPGPPELLERRPDWGAGKRNFLALDLRAARPSRRCASCSAGSCRACPRPRCARSSRAPTASRCTRSRPSGCSSPTAGCARGGRHGYEPVGDLGELAVPETLHALIAARLDALDPADRGAGPGRGGARPDLHARRRSPRSPASSRGRRSSRGSTRARPARAPAASRSTRGRPSAASTRSSRRSSARSPTPRCRSATGAARHLAAARYFESLGDDELAGALAAHYLAAYRASTEGPEAEALAAQARIALRAAAERATALGAPGQAVTFLDQALEVTDAERRSRRAARAGGGGGLERGHPGGGARSLRGGATPLRGAGRPAEPGPDGGPGRQRARPAQAPRRGDGAPRSRLGRVRGPRRGRPEPDRDRRARSPALP